MLPVRELLANYLLKRQDWVLGQLLEAILQSPDLVEIRPIVRSPQYAQAVGTLLRLLVLNVADPQDRRAFHYAHQRAQERFRQNIPATQMMRLAGLHRHILTGMVQSQFGDDPALLRPMIEIIDAQTSEIEVIFTDAYQQARDKQWQVSQTKYFSLFENASEAILSFRPGEGRIIEVNVQAERLCARPRAQMLGSQFCELFPAEHREQVKWLVEQPGGTSNLRLEDMAVKRPNDMVVPISLSCNWIQVDGEAVAQVIMRDVTQLRQMQRELQNYAEQLEERVAARTHQLGQSEERYRALFLQEQRRARHLSLINEVQQSALTTRDVATFLHEATQAIQSHFRNCDVTFFLRESSREDFLEAAPVHAALNEAGEGTMADRNGTMERNGADHALTETPTGEALVAVAGAGGHGLSLPIGGRQPIDFGLAGQTLSTAQIQHRPAWPSDAPDGAHQGANRQNGVAAFRPPGVHRDARAEVCVPVVLDGQTIGVVSAQSEEADAFDERDGEALATAAAIVASHLQGSRLFREMHDLSEFNQTLISTMLHSLMVLDRMGRVKFVNDRLCFTLHRTRDSLMNQPLEHVFGPPLVEKHHLYDVVQDVTEHGTPRELQEVHIWTPEATFIFDLRLSRVYFRGEAQVVVLLINLTLRWRKTYQLQMMNEMGRLFQASLDINQVLYTVLTCITAGSALGFNRAFLLLRDSSATDGDADILRGAMALGPSDAEEASRVWRELGNRDMSLQETLAQAPALDAANPTPLQTRALSLTMDLNNPCFARLASVVRERRAVRLSREELLASDDVTQDQAMAKRYQNECESASSLLETAEIAVAPLVVKDRVVGVVLADNLYSGAPVEADDIQLLDTLAQQASLTVDNALAYQALQKAQKEVVSAERLVAVGEMAARVSHEIRNPLATIGGFARSVLKKPEDTEAVKRKTTVITEEVARLEELLSDLLDMARPRRLDLQAQNLNEIVEHSLLLAGADVKAANAHVETQLAPDLPPVLCDRSRLLQALLNVMRNGAQAMQNGGTLFVATRLELNHERDSSDERDWFAIEIRDTGRGISQQAVKQVFDPFFSTKIQGSGLGLPITRRIIQDHGGDIEVRSEEGKGTTFVFYLPLRASNGMVATE